jgi:predicted esterase
MLERNATQHQGQPVITAGLALPQAKAVLILLHGRGAGAYDILPLAEALEASQFACLAPQAAGYTWYPYSFLAPIEQNEPWLSSALQWVSDLVEQVEAAGIPAERIILGGFSQGACLASEFVARNARRYGGLLTFSGGLIGPPGMPRHYPGSLQGTPVFLGCSDIDPHIPLSRVEESAETLAQLGGAVTKKIYPGMGHQIIDDEILEAKKILQSLVAE